MLHPRITLLLPILLVTLLVGCESYDEQMARLAREWTERQAQQNEEMARLNREVTEGNRIVAEASAAARQENLAMQHDLQTQRSQLATDRQAFSAELRRDSLWIPVIEWLGWMTVVSLPLVLCWLLLARSPKEPESTDVSELLIEELISQHPDWLTPDSPPTPIEHDTARMLSKSASPHE